MPNREPMTALWRLASEKIMLGDFPPSSRDIFFTLPAAARITSLPTSVEPVKAILSTRSEAAELVGRARRVRSGLQDYGATYGQRGRDLPGGQEDGEVPGRNDPYNPNRLLEDQADGVVHVVGHHLSLHVQGEPGVVVEHVGGHGDLHPRLAEGLANLGGEEAGKVIMLLADLVGGLAEDLSALAGGGLAPSAAIEGVAGGPGGGGGAPPA